MQQFLETIPWAELPNLAEHRDQHMAEGAHHDVSAFAVGLDLLLRGLAAR